MRKPYDCGWYLLVLRVSTASLACGSSSFGARMFDDKSSITAQRHASREFQRTNPHCWIQVLVPR